MNVVNKCGSFTSFRFTYSVDFFGSTQGVVGLITSGQQFDLTERIVIDFMLISLISPLGRINGLDHSLNLIKDQIWTPQSNQLHDEELIDSSIIRRNKFAKNSK